MKFQIGGFVNRRCEACNARMYVAEIRRRQKILVAKCGCCKKEYLFRIVPARGK